MPGTAARPPLAIALVVAAATILTACVSAAPEAPTAPIPAASTEAGAVEVGDDSILPELDALLAASLDERFASVTTTEGDLPGTCRTTIASVESPAAVSAADVDELVAYLGVASTYERCLATVRLVDGDGEVVPLAHLAQHLPVVALESGEVEVEPAGG
ncbi:MULTISPECIES: hypothetical protein [unclassified Agrococcus]|uniref:hypothetical protein n=1 Tax=unclassified Agrococcus TaxID=2615065 RepID=UPI00360CD489